MPHYVTESALINVAILMLCGVDALDWSEMSEVLPALVTIVMIPLIILHCQWHSSRVYHLCGG